jgi:cell division protein FtsQ
VAVTTDLQGRLAARGRGRRRTRLAVTLSLTTVLVLAGVAGWLLLGTAVLGVRQVEVTGTSRLDPAMVRSVAGIAAGTPLARLDTGAIAARLARLPVVAGVEVQRRWPRTVTIRVRERQAAAVQASGPSYELVDRVGVAFATVSRRPAGLPLVSAPVDAGAPALRAALDVLEALPAVVRGQVQQVRATSAEEVEVRLSRGRTVLWGSPDRGARKAAVLGVLISRKARVYDVSAPDAPTTRK